MCTMNDSWTGLQSTLPRLLPKLGIEPFPVVGVEAQITASKDGDFFRWHNDNGQDEVSGRKITFVYFFHREPKLFGGGELRIQSPVIETRAWKVGITTRSFPGKINLCFSTAP